MRHYTRKQISETIKYWERYLCENYPDTAVNEGFSDLMKGLGTFLKKSFDWFLNKVKNAAANTGISDLKTVLKTRCKNKIADDLALAEKIKFVVDINNKKFAPQKIITSVDGKAIVFAIDPSKKYSAPKDAVCTMQTMSDSLNQQNVANKDITSIFSKILVFDVADSTIQKYMSGKETPDVSTQSADTTPQQSDSAGQPAQAASADPSSKPKQTKSQKKTTKPNSTSVAGKTSVTENIEASAEYDIFSKIKYESILTQFDRGTSSDILVLKFSNSSTPANTQTLTTGEKQKAGFLG